MKYIKSQLSEDLAKKILGNKTNALEYLTQLTQDKPSQLLQFRTVVKGKNAGTQVIAITQADIWKTVVDTWNYETSLKIIRNIFKTTPKYKSGKDADKAMDILIQEWSSLKLGGLAWPFSQGAFDDFVQRVNSESIPGLEKDEKVKDAAVKYRRIKEINTVRNDFIETLIFDKNENILPTLNHRRGVDFFVDGVSYDQKVAKSPTAKFKKDHGDNWRQRAIAQPGLVAEYLYKYQDEGRFGADPRILVVYLDEDVSIERIREIINNTDLSNPTEISFTYSHKIQGGKTYKVPCFIILLYN